MTGRATHTQWIGEEGRAQLAAVQVAPGEERQVESNLVPRTSVIIPAYNEEEGIGIVLEKLYAVVDESYEVIVVDDGSTDATRQAALRFPCRLLSHGTNCGKAEAMRTGVAASRGEFIIFIDADDTYPAESIPMMVRMASDHDMVVGSRVGGRNHVPPINRVGNVIFRLAVRYLYGFRSRDPLTGLYGIKKSHLTKMNLESAGFCVEAEIAIKAARMGLTVSEIPIQYRPRVGEAKLRGFADGYRILQAILKMLALYNPTLSLTIPGVTLFAMGLLVMASLSFGSLSFGGVNLAFNSFVLAAMLALAAFQLAVFGLLLNFYGVAHKFTQKDVLVGLLMRDHMPRNFGLAGLVLIGVSVGLASWLGPGWLGGELDSVNAAKRLVSVSFIGVFGFQLVISSIFVSIFSQELAVSGARADTAREELGRLGREQGERGQNQIVPDLRDDQDAAVGYRPR